MVENEHEYMKVSVSESNMGFRKDWMQGLPGPPYEKGDFLLYVDIGEKYPTKPPEAKFITPILHQDVMKVRVCLFFYIFYRNIHIDNLFRPPSFLFAASNSFTNPLKVFGTRS